MLEAWRLEAELGRWRRAGRVASLWWRDDDARGPCAALDRLVALSDRWKTPLALAVVPDPRNAELAPVLAARPRLAVLQHGCDHRNRREGAAAGEFPREWPAGRIEAAVRAGWRTVSGLPGALPVFAPPWNDVHPDVAASLRRCGFRALSAWGELDASEGLLRVDAHLDLMRWRKGPRFRGARRMRRALARALAERRRAGRWDAPIGLLTHHLDHDEAAWTFLDRFLGWSAARPELRWVGAAELFGVSMASAA